MDSDDTFAIEISALVKFFGEVRAVDGLDLTVRRGVVHAVLGPNGAGKTTMIRVLATLLRPDSGSATVFGHDVVRAADAVRGRIGLTGQFASIDEGLTGIENLVLIARLLGHSWAAARARGSELLEAIGLADAAGRRVSTYSGGMRRLLDIAASIVVTPDLIFLDEPTTGLDPRSRNQVWEVVRTLVAEGTTVLLTTQYLDEADQLADQISVIDHGKAIANGTSNELKASIGAGSLKVQVRDSGVREEAQRLLAKTLDVAVERAPDPAALFARVIDPDQVGPALAALSDAGIGVTGFALGQPSLDEVFLALTGRTANDQADEADTEHPGASTDTDSARKVGHRT